MMAHYQARRPLSALFTEVISEVTNLFHTELRLARTEMKEKFGQVLGFTSVLVTGAILLLASLMFFLQAVVLWLEVLGVPQRWGTLGVAAVSGLIGFLVLSNGMNSIKASNLTPERTLRQIRDDVSVAKEQIR
jgi:uncharacterized membrane protein YqjE